MKSCNFLIGHNLYYNQQESAQRGNQICLSTFYKIQYLYWPLVHWKVQWPVWKFNDLLQNRFSKNQSHKNGLFTKFYFIKWIFHKIPSRIRRYRNVIEWFITHLILQFSDNSIWCHFILRIWSLFLSWSWQMRSLFSHPLPAYSCII